MKNRDDIKAILLSDYTEPNFWARLTLLTVELDPDATRVTSRVTYEHNPKRPKTLDLNGKDLLLLEAKINGKSLDLTMLRYDAHSLHLSDLPDRFELELTTEICPRKNTALEGIYLSQGKFYTQCESNGFRRITYYLDRPDVMAEFKTTIVAPEGKYPILLSNGNLIEKGRKEDGRIFAVWHDPFPKPSYLFAMVAGDLGHLQDSYVTKSGRKVSLHVYVEHENLNKCAFAFEAIKKAMRWDEDVYNLEYDLDTFIVVAVSDFNMGAMENKGLNIFNSKFVLASPETATDRDFESILGVVGHEYFHNWTGNRVTLRDWFQLSLKEGLTVFRDQQFSADHGSKAVKRIQDVKRLREHQFPEDSSPMAHPVRPESYIEINNFYTPTVYEKGAEIIRMLHTLVGDDCFHAGMRLYFARFDGKAATVEDLLKVMEEASKRDLSRFKLWYQQAGTPTVRLHLDGEKLEVKQILPPTPGQQHKKAQLIPMRLAFLDQNGKALNVNYRGRLAHEHLVEIEELVQTFHFPGLPRNAIPSAFRGFSAPVRIEANLSQEQILVQLAAETDSFNRFEAAQTLASQIIRQRAADPDYALDEHYIAAFRRLITDEKQEPRLIALSMIPPPVDYLVQQEAEADLERLFAASEWLNKTLGTLCSKELWSIYLRMKNADPLAIDKDSIARRELRNACLSLLASTETEDATQLARQHYFEAKNMTDAAAALAALAPLTHPAREECLADFYKRWKHDALVIDKWFAIQAGSAHPQVLQQVKALLQHEDFDIFNPNRVYSVFRLFARCNPYGFHNINGEGYRIVMDYALRIDKANPQVAAMLAGQLTRYRVFDKDRREMMLGCLKEIASHSPLSPDVFEVVSKSIKD